jgi:tripartite-type tricarboxylate transporter receptor subunit TctC
MASGGTGSASHIGGEFFKTMTGVDMLHVPYKGGAPATTDLMGGTIQVYFSPLPESIGVVKGGKVRALAVTTAKRVASLPDVPTIGESVPGFEISTWQGIGAPKNTPTEIVAALNREINAGLADPKVKARILELGGEPAPISTVDFEKRVVDETARWAKVIRDAKIPLQ